MSDLDHARIAVVLLIVGILPLIAYVLSQEPCEPDCQLCLMKRQERSRQALARWWGHQWCQQHQMPKHECRDEHRS